MKFGTAMYRMFVIALLVEIGWFVEYGMHSQALGLLTGAAIAGTALVMDRGFK